MVEENSNNIESTETNSAEAKDPTAQSVNLPPWLKRIGKMMVIFAILGCILLCVGALLLNSVIENALSSHGL